MISAYCHLVIAVSILVLALATSSFAVEPPTSLLRRPRHDDDADSMIQFDRSPSVMDFTAAPFGDRTTPSIGNRLTVPDAPTYTLAVPTDTHYDGVSKFQADQDLANELFGSNSI